MASPQDNPISSVEVDNSLVLYKATTNEDFDVIMGNSQHELVPSETRVTNPPPWLVTLHEQLTLAHDQVREIALSVGQNHSQQLASLKEQYEVLRKNYAVVTNLFEAGIEASQASVARLEHQVQQASSRFASEVWGAIAKYGRNDEERLKAINHLQEVSQLHQKALETLNERTARQQSLLGHVENWATTKDQQIGDIFDKLVDPSQLKALEEQITNLQRTIEQAGQKAPDTASILRLLEQRAATKAPSTTQPSFLSEPSFGFLRDNDLQAAQARRQANQARMQQEATYADNYGTGSVRFGQSAGGQGPPGPPRPPRNTLGPAGNDDDHAQNQADSFLANWGYPTIQTTPIHLNKPVTYDGKKTRCLPTLVGPYQRLPPCLRC